MGVCTAGRASIAVCVAGLLLAGSVGFTLNAQQKPAGPSLPADPRLPLVEEYCVSCHDEDKKKGNLALDTVAAHDVAQHPDVWEKVVRKLRARQMPPVGKAAAGRRHLRRGDRLAGEVARPRGRSQSESRANRDVPAAHSNRIPERHPRSPRRWRSMPPRCCPPTNPATASTM